MANRSKLTRAAATTRSSARRPLSTSKPRGPRRLRRAALGVLLAASLLISSCSTTGGYWIPPSSSATPPVELASLPGQTAGGDSIPDAADTGEIPSNSPIVDLEQTQAAAAVAAALETVVPLETAAPTETPVLNPTDTAGTPDPASQQPLIPSVDTAPYLYKAQAADTLPAVAVRFDVLPEEITSPDPLDPAAVLNPGQLLVIPRRLMNTTTSQQILPDSELVYSPSATDFDIHSYVSLAGGKLNTYREWLKSTGLTSGAGVVQRVALENSINPRLLLALLEFQNHWVSGQPTSPDEVNYPLGLVNASEKGLYHQLVWAVNQLSVGYYSWREGRLTELKFSDGVTARLAPDLNAGSAAVQYYFSHLYPDSQRWLQALDPQQGFPALYEEMFGSPWERAQRVEPLYPPGLAQPPMILPFVLDQYWSFTGGPHGAWEHDGSYAAIDFAPPSTAAGCIKSNVWVTAAASGLVVRSEPGVVVLDLDGDGYEQTGWVLLYLHVSTEGRIPVGSWVETGTPLGHPSCEGGLSTGTHLHLARKYNGEWIAAAGPMPFVLSGWVTQAGQQAYKGSLVRDDQVVEACTCSSAKTWIGRTENDP